MNNQDRIRFSSFLSSMQLISHLFAIHSAHLGGLESETPSQYALSFL